MKHETMKVILFDHKITLMLIRLLCSLWLVRYIINVALSIAITNIPPVLSLLIHINYHQRLKFELSTLEV